jgi:hypothetical protein
MKQVYLFTFLFNATVFLGVCGLGTQLQAGTLDVTVPNFSYENPASSSDHIQGVQGGNHPDQPNGLQTSYIQDWTVLQYNDSAYGTVNYASDSSITGGLGSQGAYLDTNYEYYQIFLTSGSSTNNDGTAAGTTGFVTTVLPDTTYTLTVAVGVPTSSPPVSGSDAPGLILNLVDSAGNTFATTGLGAIPYSSLSQGTLTDETLTFTSGATPADLGQGLQIQFVLSNGYDPQSQGGAVFDDVRLTESGPDVPEPGTWAMMLLGSAGLVLFARCKLIA